MHDTNQYQSFEYDLTMTTTQQADLNDLGLVAPLFEHYRLFYKKEPDQQGANDFIKARLENNDSVIFLAKVDGQPAGFVQLYPTFSSTTMQKSWILNDLFVANNFRQLKVGSALMNAAKQHAIDTDSHSLKLCTSVDNHQAQALYVQLGYHKTVSFEHYILPV